MQKAPLWVELYLAIWAALAIPLLFAGVVFLVPGFDVVVGVALLGITGIDLAYLWLLTRPYRRAWYFGVAAHLALIPVSAYFVQAGPRALAAPALALNALSLVVLLAYRRVWLAEASAEART